MLHSINPAEFFPPAALHTPGICPDCGEKREIADGVVGLLHYRGNGDQITQGLIWVCTPMCILNFEHTSTMGRA